MPVTNEKAVVHRLLIQMDDEGAAQRARRLRIENMLNRIFAGIIVLALVGTGLLDLVWHDILLIVGVFLVGFSVAWDAARNAHSRTLDIVEKYLDRGGIERRLQVLNSP